MKVTIYGKSDFFVQIISVVVKVKGKFMVSKKK